MSALLEAFAHGDAVARVESWRYSRQALRALEQKAFVSASVDNALSSESIVRYDWPRTRGRRLVFINGVHSARYSDVAAVPSSHAGVRIEHDATHTRIAVASGDVGTLHLVYVNVPGAQPLRWQAQTQIRVAGGSAQIIEQHLGACGGEVLGAPQTTIHVSGGAHLRMLSLSDLPDTVAAIRRMQVEITAQSQCEITHAIFGGRLQRVDLEVALNGSQASFGSSGAFALRGREHVDVHLQLRHAARDTRCAVSWRGVADQRARGIFHGAILVEPGADGTDARLQTHNLLLSEHAEIDAQPVLEIHADEVQASHGATVGRLDERALFYLRSRGVPLAAARSLLIAAFCREVFEAVPDAALRELLDAALRARLPREELA